MTRPFVPPAGDSFAQDVARARSERLAGCGAAGPVARIRTSPRFRAELAALPPGLRRKVTDVCTEIAAGMAHEIPGRRIHPLRTGRGGNCPPARHRGRIVYRCAIENGRPAARRLHFCRRADGSIEFLSITTHDARRPF